jgi:hypothetical protein
MILPYLLRLLCLCFTSFFLLNAACSALVLACAKSAVRFAETKTARAAAGLLFLLRLLPLALAVLFVVCLCVPSYLWLEPSATAEQVGPLCLFFGSLGCAAWLVSLARAARALAHSYLRTRRWARTGPEARIPGEPASLIVVEDQLPILAMSGLLRPRVVVSRGILSALSLEELEAAFSHEQAHRVSRDNFKRFLLLLAPDVLPFFRPLSTLDTNWCRFVEWAADDFAARGNSLRAVSLASALVRVARLGAAPRLPELSTSLLACNRDLSVRVARLLVVDAVSPVRAPQSPSLLRRPFYFIAAGLAFGLLSPIILSSVHQLLERLLH